MVLGAALFAGPAASAARDAAGMFFSTSLRRAGSRREHNSRRSRVAAVNRRLSSRAPKLAGFLRRQVRARHTPTYQ